MGVDTPPVREVSGCSNQLLVSKEVRLLETCCWSELTKKIRKMLICRQRVVSWESKLTLSTLLGWMSVLVTSAGPLWYRSDCLKSE